MEQKTSSLLDLWFTSGRMLVVKEQRGQIDIALTHLGISSFLLGSILWNRKIVKPKSN
jgi:hypothetical protein